MKCRFNVSDTTYLDEPEKYQILVSVLKLRYVRKPEKKHSIEINCIAYPLDKVNFKIFEKLNTLTSVEGSNPENLKLCEFNIYHQVGKTCIPITHSLLSSAHFQEQKSRPARCAKGHQSGSVFCVLIEIFAQDSAIFSFTLNTQNATPEMID